MEPLAQRTTMPTAQPHEQLQEARPEGERGAGGRGPWRRIVGTLVRALQRGILGKSGNRFTGSERYWDRVIAAQLGWPEQYAPPSAPACSPSASRPTQSNGPSAPVTPGRPSEPQHEPALHP